MTTRHLSHAVRRSIVEGEMHGASYLGVEALHGFVVRDGERETIKIQDGVPFVNVLNFVGPLTDAWNSAPAEKREGLEWLR